MLIKERVNQHLYGYINHVLKFYNPALLLDPIYFIYFAVVFSGCFSTFRPHLDHLKGWIPSSKLSKLQVRVEPYLVSLRAEGHGNIRGCRWMRRDVPRKTYGEYHAGWGPPDM